MSLEMLERVFGTVGLLLIYVLQKTADDVEGQPRWEILDRLALLALAGERIIDGGIPTGLIEGLDYEKD
jgi:hypothetical protein